MKHRNSLSVSGISLLAMALALPAAMLAQEGGGQGAFAGMQRATGEVTAVAAPNVTVKAEDGATYTIVTTDNTRVMRAQAGTMRGGGGGQRPAGGAGQPQPIKVAEIQVGDGLMAMGQMDAPKKTLHAVMVFDTDAATVKAMRDNLGKTYITGKVTAIDLDKPSLTLERPDKVVQTIGFDEGTSFRRGGRGRAAAGAAPAAGTAAAAGGESITLADIHVGDQVSGDGAVKAGVFVPVHLVVAPPRRERPASEAAPAAK